MSDFLFCCQVLYLLCLEYWFYLLIKLFHKEPTKPMDLQAKPERQLENRGSTHIKATHHMKLSWKSPEMRNGKITGYEVR